MDSMAEKIAEVRRIIVRSREREKANRRDHILAASGMRFLEQAGMPRGRIYEEVGLDDKWGPMYFRLLDFYEMLPPAELERILNEDESAAETSLLSLTQVQCINRVIGLVPLSEHEAFVKKVMFERLTGRDIENLAGGQGDRLAGKLGLTGEAMAAAGAAAPRSPEPTYEVREDRVVIAPSARSLASLLAALSNAEGVRAIGGAAKGRIPVEVRWRG